VSATRSQDDHGAAPAPGPQAAREAQDGAQDAARHAQASELTLRAAAAQALVDELAQANRALRRALATAEEATRAAEAANQAKGVFLSMMSHELRLPLDAIQGAAELLGLGLRGPVTDAQRADLARIGRASRHLEVLVTDLLAFARLEAGHDQPQAAPADVAAVVADLELLVTPHLAAKDLTFDHDAGVPRGNAGTGGRPTRVTGDPERVRQILLTLVAHAITATNPGGRVTLACEADCVGHLAADGRADGAGDVVRIRVTDAGRGMVPDRLAAVFDPLVHMDRHRTPGGPPDVDLAISRDLARGMGGDLTAESTPGVGSTFTLTLPAA
jgi:signal transduction histidine kinase